MVEDVDLIAGTKGAFPAISNLEIYIMQHVIFAVFQFQNTMNWKLFFMSG